MPVAKVRASTIIGEFEQAETELVSKAVILADGKAGIRLINQDVVHLFDNVRTPRHKVCSQRKVR
jgi:hypothetical protein